jgi:hypothetical protein
MNSGHDTCVSFPNHDLGSRAKSEQGSAYKSHLRQSWMIHNSSPLVLKVSLSAPSIQEATTHDECLSFSQYKGIECSRYVYPVQSYTQAADQTHLRNQHGYTARAASAAQDDHTYQ